MKIALFHILLILFFSPLPLDQGRHFSQSETFNLDPQLGRRLEVANFMHGIQKLRVYING